MKLVGIQVNEGTFIKEWDLGNTAEIIARLVGGNRTQYKCDQQWVTPDPSTNIVMFNGNAGDSTAAGLGYFSSYNNAQTHNNYAGYRSSCVIK